MRGTLKLAGSLTSVRDRAAVERNVAMLTSAVAALIKQDLGLPGVMMDLVTRLRAEGESPMTGTDALLGRLGNAPPLTRTEV